MTKYCILTLMAAWAAVWAASVAPCGELSETGSRVCLVDGKEVKGDLHVDVAGVRLYACSDECLKKITENRGYVRLIQESGREPEQIPIKRSRELAVDEVLKGMVPIEGGEFTHLISSSLAYGRYFDPLDPRYNEAHVAFYQGLEKHYKIVAVFEDRRLEFSNPTITVYEWRGTETDE